MQDLREFVEALADTLGLEVVEKPTAPPPQEAERPEWAARYDEMHIEDLVDELMAIERDWARHGIEQGERGKLVTAQITQFADGVKDALRAQTGCGKLGSRLDLSQLSRLFRYRPDRAVTEDFKQRQSYLLHRLRIHVLRGLAARVGLAELGRLECNPFAALPEEWVKAAKEARIG